MKRTLISLCKTPNNRFFVQTLIALFYMLNIQSLSAQDIDSNLLKIKRRMDSIEEFSAQIRLDLDVSFINMPAKNAEMHYIKGKPVDFSSDDFVLIPKRGLDFTLNEIFKYSFFTVNRGMEEKNSILCKVINVIPTDKKADFAIATLIMDTVKNRIIETEITTKKDGSYTLLMQYEKPISVLPYMVEVNFEMERIKIPLNYMAKDVEIDKKKLSSEDLKTGKIFLQISDYKIRFMEDN